MWIILPLKFSKVMFQWFLIILIYTLITYWSNNYWTLTFEIVSEKIQILFREKIIFTLLVKFKFKKESISKIFHVLKNRISFELVQIIFYPFFHLCPAQPAKTSKARLKMIKKCDLFNFSFQDRLSIPILLILKKNFR